jgi:hypothetical protein
MLKVDSVMFVLYFSSNFTILKKVFTGTGLNVVLMKFCWLSIGKMAKAYEMF